jgi:non-ribosomal peptide synthetase component E (peptide arylation enzyme)
MILVDAETSRDRVAAGDWGVTTLDELFRAVAAVNPGRPAFVDAPDRRHWCPGRSGTASYAEADRRIEALAAFFSSLGLRQDAVLGLNMPNIADAYVTALAAWRAGLIVAPLPIGWSRAETAAAIERLGIRAIVTTASVEGERLAEAMRELAAETFSLRLLFGWGDDLPDGVIDLDAALTEPEAFGAAPVLSLSGNPADHVAFIGWAAGEDGTRVPVPFSHNQIAAMGAAHAAEADLATGSRLMSTLLPAGIAAFGGGLATAFAVGGTLIAHHATTIETLVRHLQDARPGQLLVPASLCAPLVALAGPRLPGLSAVSCRREFAATDVPLVDLWTAGGVTLLPTWRGAGTIPLGRDPRPVVVAEAAAGTVGTVVLAPADRRGLVADRAWPRLRGGPERLVAQHPAEDHYVVGGVAVAAAELDALYQDFPGALDAATFPVDDALLGTRFGVALVPRADAEAGATAFSAYLDERGVGDSRRPALFIHVDAIPRAKDGRVSRTDLAA